MTTALSYGARDLANSVLHDRLPPPNLLDLIPKIYDTPRIIRILGEDGAPSMAAIGQQQQLSPEQTAQWQGYERVYDLGLGKRLRLGSLLRIHRVPLVCA